MVMGSRHPDAGRTRGQSSCVQLNPVQAGTQGQATAGCDLLKRLSAAGIRHKCTYNSVSTGQLALSVTAMCGSGVRGARDHIRILAQVHVSQSFALCGWNVILVRAASRLLMSSHWTTAS